MSRPVTLTLKGLFVLALFGVLIWIAPLDRTLNVVLSSWFPLLAAAFGIRMILIGVSAFKLHLLLPLRSSEDPFGRRLRQLFGIYTIGRFFTNFIPTSVGGDVMKVREMSLAGHPLPDATRAVFLERLTGILAVYGIAMLALLPGTGLPEMFGLTDWRYPLLGAGLLPLPVLAYLYRQGVPPSLTSLADRLLDWQTFLPDHLTSLEGRVSRGTLTAVLGISVAYHAARVLLLGALVLSIGRSVPFLGLLGAVPIITFISLLPVSLGSLGLREGAITFSLTALGLTPPEAFGVALLSRLIGVGVSLVGGIVYLLRPIPEDPSPGRPETGGTQPGDDPAAGPEGSRS